MGQWLPEPLVTDTSDTSDTSDPSVAAELADSLSLAFLVLLEELTPAERAALIFRDVFSYGYAEVAADPRAKRAGLPSAPHLGAPADRRTPAPVRR